MARPLRALKPRGRLRERVLGNVNPRNQRAAAVSSTRGYFPLFNSRTKVFLSYSKAWGPTPKMASWGRLSRADVASRHSLAPRCVQALRLFPVLRMNPAACAQAQNAVASMVFCKCARVSSRPRADSMVFTREERRPI